MVEVRRYRCCRCRTVVTVAPPAALPRRHYSRAAIALALARFGLLGEPAAEVRRRVSPWRIVGAAAAGTWATLKRWARAAGQGRLKLAGSQAQLGGLTAREVAASAAQIAVGASPPGLRHRDLAAQAFYGALAAV